MVQLTQPEPRRGNEDLVELARPCELSNRNHTRSEDDLFRQRSLPKSEKKPRNQRPLAVSLVTCIGVRLTTTQFLTPCQLANASHILFALGLSNAHSVYIGPKNRRGASKYGATGEGLSMMACQTVSTGNAYISANGSINVGTRVRGNPRRERVGRRLEREGSPPYEPRGMCRGWSQ